MIQFERKRPKEGGGFFRNFREKEERRKEKEKDSIRVSKRQERVWREIYQRVYRERERVSRERERE